MKKVLLVLIVLAYFSSYSQQSMYDPDLITIVELTFKESNWDAILDDYKINSNNAESSCNHDYEDERLLAHCVINGVAFDSVGVKFKGNSTYNANNTKNPVIV